MKKVFFLLFTLIAFTASAQHHFKHLIGRWEAVDGSGLDVKDSAKISLFFHSDSKPVIDYQADFTKSPGWFDFTVKDSVEQYRVKSLIRFIHDDLIQWQIFEGERPSSFDPTKEVLYLRRKK